ncbi:MAG: 3-hydroxybenzoate 6-monooxygenase [Betaproteobacteria bacterium]
MSSAAARSAEVLVAGGGIGGLAVALALGRLGQRVRVFEQSHEIGEIGAGIQLGPNAFAAFDALGVGAQARSRAVYTDRMLMLDALDGSTIIDFPLGEAFRERFRNPYAVIHRADVHRTLLEGVKALELVSFETGTRVSEVSADAAGVSVTDQRGNRFEGCALIGCDGVKSVVRQTFVGDDVRVSGHVVYRAVVDAADFPEDLKLNAPVVWSGPDCHLVHYPLRAGEQYNVVVTFHSRRAETWGVAEGSADEVQSYFQGILPRARQLLMLPKSWKRWATADREPIARWSYGPVTLLGDAAHPMLQYLAQGACMALEDAVTLAAAVRANEGDFTTAFAHYERSRVTRTARVLLMAREMGRIYHAKGVERLVRNDLWKGRTAQRYYDAVEWLYDWDPARALAR